MSNEGNNNTIKKELNFEMIVIGDSAVGKSCLTSRAVRDIFDPKYYPTAGFEYLSYTTKIDDQDIKLKVWDTSGQETCIPLITNFYRKAYLVMMIYSIDNRESFIHINKWLKEVKL